MKNIKRNVFLVTLFLPFLLVWSFSLATAFSFDPREVFIHPAFWGISIIYWFIWLCIIGMVLEDIKEPAK